MQKLKQLRVSRLLINLVRIPYIFFLKKGHLSRKGPFSVDANGEYVPWLTYPFIDYINNLDIRDCRVFEYGSGASSFWWSSRANDVCSVEMDPLWAGFLEKQLPHNNKLVLCEDGGQYPNAILGFEGLFDIVVVDGAERYKSAATAIQKLSERGIVVLDNSDWYPNTADMLRDTGFVQIDFYGFSPGNSFPTVTSLFYRNNIILSRHKQGLHKVDGGNLIAGGALDDGDK